MTAIDVRAAELQALIAAGQAAPAEARAWLESVVAEARLSVVLGVRVIGARLSVDAYLDALAVVAMSTPPGFQCDQVGWLLDDLAPRMGRDPGDVRARVALAWGGAVPEAEGTLHG